MADKKTFVLRLDPKTWDALQRLAADEFRSVNGQVEFILRDYLRKRKRIKDEPEAETDQSTNSTE
jgi:hypothetical protein